MKRLCLILPCLISLLALPAGATHVRFDAAGDPFERATVFRLDLDLPVWTVAGVTTGAAYGQRSYWALTNDGGNDRVETDFAPMVYGQIARGRWGFRAGHLHESNGRLNEASRAWNRAALRVTRELDSARVGLDVWYAHGLEDTNPDLRRTVGDGAVFAATRIDPRWSFALRVGFTVDPPDDGPITNVRAQVVAASPRWFYDEDDVRLLLELFWGRGESLLRNEEITRAVRFGLSITR